MTFEEWKVTLLPFEAKALTRREIFQAGAASRDAEVTKWIERVNSWTRDCERLAEERDRLRAEVETLKKRLEFDEHGYDGIFCRDQTIKLLDIVNERLRAEAEASQAENVRLRGNLENIGNKARIRDAVWVELTVAEALAAPSDTSALEAVIKKAEEKMRERCSEIADCSSIRALPANQAATLLRSTCKKDQK